MYNEVMKINNIFLKIFVAVTFVAMVVVNALANILPINGIQTGAVSDSYPNLFAPAGITFAIWGLIYTLLAIYTVYQTGLINKVNNKIIKDVINRINILFIITSVTNFAWIFAWHYRYIGLTVILMLVLLVSLIKIANVLAKHKLDTKEMIFVHTPFSVYFGWITVATIANITVWLVSVGWDGFGIAQDIWTIAVLLVGAAIGILRGMKDRNAAYLLVFAWAYFGIWYKHTSPTGFDGVYGGVIATALICIALFLAAASMLFYKAISSNSSS